MSSQQPETPKTPLAEPILCKMGCGFFVSWIIRIFLIVCHQGDKKKYVSSDAHREGQNIDTIYCLRALYEEKRTNIFFGNEMSLVSAVEKSIELLK